MPLGEEVEIRGPTGDITYLGNSDFLISHRSPTQQPRKLHFPRVSLILGVSGITHGYALMKRIVETKGDETEVRGVDANRTEGDILLKGELDAFESESDGRVKVVHVLSRAEDGWQGERGRVDGEMLRRVLFPPGEGSVVFLCGPPGLVQGVALPALKGMFSPLDGGAGWVNIDWGQNGGILRTKICLGFEFGRCEAG
jgi:nitrate reductase (NAD(P)H)